MSVNHLFVGYMALVGLATGGALVAAPHLGEFWIKPYFWVLIAAFLFDAIVAIRGRTDPSSRLAMEFRFIGFGIGIVLMVVIIKALNSPAKFF